MFLNTFLQNNIKNKHDHDRTSNDSLSLPQHLLQPLQQPRHKEECTGVDNNSKFDRVQQSVDDKEAMLVVSSRIDPAADAGSADGATVEVPKRRRGRPPGSRNKPKPPLFITREAEPPSAAMRPHVIEIPAGYDVGDSLARFARRHNLGICVLACSGAVANVVLRQPQFGVAQQPLVPAAAAATTVAFRGRLEILSISATFLPPVMTALSPGISGAMSISLAGPQGQVVGGAVAGPLMTAGTVVVMAASFSNPSFHRLPLDDEVMVRVSISDGGGEAQETENHKHGAEKQRGHRKRDHQGRPAVTAAESCDMSICSFHASPEVVWAPSFRPPPPF